jgi:hypothetical protein
LNETCNGTGSRSTTSTLSRVTHDRRFRPRLSGSLATNARRPGSIPSTRSKSARCVHARSVQGGSGGSSPAISSAPFGRESTNRLSMKCRRSRDINTELKSVAYQATYGTPRDSS